MNQGTVQIAVGHIKSFLRGVIPKDAYKKIDMLLSFRVQRAEFIPSFKEGRWDGRIRLFEMGDLSFPTGLISKLTDLLTGLGIPFQIIEQRNLSEKVFHWEWKSTKIKTLYPYQQEAVQNSINRKNGIIQIATGGGKTIIMCKLIQELGRRSLILVHKLDLLEQARDKIVECLDIDVGYIGNGRVEISEITVGTVQTIVKALNQRYVKFSDDEVCEKIVLKEAEKERIRHLLRTVNVVLIDESHHVRSETQQAIMNSVTAADFRIGLSATPKRDQGDDLLIEGIFGDILCKVSATYLIENKFLVPPTIRFSTISHTEFRFFEFVRWLPDGRIMYCDPIPKGGKATGRRRNIDIVWEEIANRKIESFDDVDECDILYTYPDGVRVVRKWNEFSGDTNFVHHIYTKLEEICDSIFSDVLDTEIKKANKKFKDSADRKKFERKIKRKYGDLKMKKKYNFIYDACITDNVYRNMFIAQMLNWHRIQGHSSLVLVRRIRHGENIQKLLPSNVIFLKGEDDVDVRTEVMDRVRGKEEDAIIASTIADEGLDLPALDCVIMAGGGTSKTTALQRVGRAIRLYDGKVKAYVEEFYDDAVYLSNHSNDREEIYRTEPAFEIVK